MRPAMGNHTMGNTSNSRYSERLETFNLGMNLEETNRADKTDTLRLQGNILKDIREGTKTIFDLSGDTAREGIGQAVGDTYADYLIESGVPISEAPRILSSLLTQGGWGKVEVELDLQRKTGIVTIVDTENLSVVHSETPSCHFLKGYFEGLIGKLADAEIQCEEESCMSKGDLACKFNISPK
jgi:predicted hydrocarbon binding protein